MAKTQVESPSASASNAGDCLCLRSPQAPSMHHSPITSTAAARKMEEITALVQYFAARIVMYSARSLDLTTSASSTPARACCPRACDASMPAQNRLCSELEVECCIRSTPQRDQQCCHRFACVRALKWRWHRGLCAHCSVAGGGSLGDPWHVYSKSSGKMDAKGARLGRCQRLI